MIKSFFGFSKTSTGFVFESLFALGLFARAEEKRTWNWKVIRDR